MRSELKSVLTPDPSSIRLKYLTQLYNNAYTVDMILLSITREAHRRRTGKDWSRLREHLCSKNCKIFRMATVRSRRRQVKRKRSEIRLGQCQFICSLIP